jgi:hypothetical protein
MEATALARQVAERIAATVAVLRGIRGSADADTIEDYDRGALHALASA